MSNTSLFVFKETAYFTVMINCFTASHIKQLQDVILFNKISILDIQSLDLFEGCLYQYRNMMFPAMFLCQIVRRKAEALEWSSKSFTYWNLWDLSNTSPRMKDFYFSPSLNIFSYCEVKIIDKIHKNCDAVLLQTICFYKWQEGKYILLPTVVSKWE